MGWGLMLLVLAQTAPVKERAVPLRELGNEEAKGTSFRADFTGQDIWRARCAMCHGVAGDGRGNPSYGARNVTAGDWQDSRSDDDIRSAIREGVRGTRMRAFKT